MISLLLYTTVLFKSVSFLDGCVLAMILIDSEVGIVTLN